MVQGGRWAHILLIIGGIALAAAIAVEPAFTCLVW
jgi:hypothetical protein